MRFILEVAFDTSSLNCFGTALSRAGWLHTKAETIGRCFPPLAVWLGQNKLPSLLLMSNK